MPAMGETWAVKSNGPRTEPCGMPVVLVTDEEQLRPIRTEEVRLVR